MNLFITALVALATAVFAILCFIGLELLRTPHLIAVIVAAMPAAAITTFLSWRENYAFEDDDADMEAIANRRGQQRVLAWTNMPITVFHRGEKVETAVLNISAGGMALHWDQPRAAPGALVRMQVPGYLVLPATVISEGGGFMRVRYTGDVPEKDRQRLRNDCIAGNWSTEEQAAPAGVTAPA